MAFGTTRLSLLSHPTRLVTARTATFMHAAPTVTRVLSGHAVSHAALLPADLVARVPHREKVVLSFVLAFLEANALPAQLLVNGGYVRDLLLGKEPDDLDLSLCLRECDPSVTVTTVMHGLHAFACERPELNVSAVTITTILSDASKDKNVDTAKAFMTVGSPPERLEVDFMPTIGDETYDEFDRVPERDVRGTPEQDALRRDLTIGAMLLHVFHPPGGGPAASGGTGVSPDEAAEAMQWRLLDFYGGLADLQARVLRSPYPIGANVDAVRASVLRSEEEVELARKLRILTPACLAGSGAAAEGEAAEEGEGEAMSVSPVGVRAPAGSGAGAERELQVLWWIKVLRDDPLRVLRALRFSAKLGFALHPTFWLAVPFAINSLQSKVAGSRKKDELLKIAKAGREPLLTFLDLAFGFPLPLPTGGSGGHLPCLAPALFGGADPKGVAQFLSPSIVQPTAVDATEQRRLQEQHRPQHLRYHDEPSGAEPMLGHGPSSVAELPPLGAPPPYHSVSMRAAAAALESELSDEEALGAALAAAVYSCALPEHKTDAEALCAAASAQEAAAEEAAGAAPAAAEPYRSPQDLRAAVAAERAMGEVQAACEGLSSSNEMRQGAHTPLMCVRALLLPPAPVGMHELFASAARRRGAPPELTGSEFVNLVHMWDTLKLTSAKKRGPGYLPEFILALAATRCGADTAAQLRVRLGTLRIEGPPISGEALGAMPTLPARLRGSVISCLHVLCRLDGHTGALTTRSELEAFLAERALVAPLDAEWYADGGAGEGSKGRELREVYAAANSRPKPKKQGKKPEPGA